MTEKEKPTYEELEKQVKDHRETKKFWNVYLSGALCVTMLMIISIFLQFAIIGANRFITETSAAEWVIQLTGAFFDVGTKVIFLYVIWHWVFVCIYNYEDEIEEWCLRHNFLKPKKLGPAND